MNFKKITFIFCCVLFLCKVNAQQSQLFSYTGSIQTWTVPSCVNQITMTAAGAQGGDNYGLIGDSLGGYGASMSGTFTVTPGTVLSIIVGQNGHNATSGNTANGAGGGGGGSFVYTTSPTILLIAAGGGGGSSLTNNGAPYYYGMAGVTTTAGTGSRSGVLYNDAVGGTNGGNGTYTTGSGEGWLAVQSNPAGIAACAYGGSGGYGGGGGSGCASCCTNSQHAAGGGGGYSGGGAGGTTYYYGGGGGGSYNIGTNQNNSAGVKHGNGGVAIKWNTAGPLAVSGNVIKNVLCYGESDGEASGIVSGGGSPYTYSWTPVVGSKDTASGLSAGNYTITVKDACGNSATASVSITQPAALNVAVDTVFNVLCNGNSNGSALSYVTGGTHPYTYAWSNLQLTPNATGLSAGTYTIGVSDGNGCTATASVSISQPNVLSASPSVISNVLCNGESDGSASSNASGGTSPYTYAWSNLQLTANATGLSAGTYTIGVSDGNGCTATASVSITEPTALNISATALTNVLCNGGTDGSASSSASGGTSPYTYSWSNAESNSNATGLSAGTYTITVMDNNGCTGTASAAITQPNALSASPSAISNVSCNGGSNGSLSSNASGGTSPYTYLWSNLQSSPNATGLAAGTYTLGLTDANGCTASASVGITQPAAIGIISHSQADNGSGNGAAWVNVSGGTGPYTYLWNPGGNSTDSISKKDSGMYCCLVTDANGCTDSTCIKIKSTLGIGNITSGSGGITVYPNPNNGQFTIESSATGGEWSVEVYNVLGEKVYSTFNIQNPTLDINLSNQPNGVYLYRVISESGSLLGEGKIMVQK